MQIPWKQSEESIFCFPIRIENHAGDFKPATVTPYRDDAKIEINSAKCVILRTTYFFTKKKSRNKCKQICEMQSDKKPENFFPHYKSCTGSFKQKSYDFWQKV